MLEKDVKIKAYDPIGINNFKKIFTSDKISFYDNIDDAVKESDITLIMTEWDEIKNYQVDNYIKLMNKPYIFDGRNCYSIEDMQKKKLYYNSIGRKTINNIK